MNRLVEAPWRSSSQVSLWMTLTAIRPSDIAGANIAKLEPKVQLRVHQLLDRIEQHRVNGKVINIS